MSRNRIGAALCASSVLASMLLAPAGRAMAGPSAERGAAPYQRCPIVEVTRPPSAKSSPMPPAPTDLPPLGGEALATTGLAVPAGAPRLPTVLSATSWVVADLETGEVLGACGAHERGAPASLQKWLLALTVLPKLDPDEEVTVTKEDLDFEPGSSAVGLVLGGRYTVETLWLGLLLNSGNDAANVLARLGGGAGGVPATLREMNATARRIGALDTHAETPHGLDGPGQATSAYDLALISRALFTRDDFRRYVTTRSAQMPAQSHLDLPEGEQQGFQIQNENRLVTEYPGAIGGKTGFTDIARHTFIGAAERDGRRLVATLLGAEHQPVHTWQQAAALLDWGFATRPGSGVGHLVAPGEAQRLLAARLIAQGLIAQPATATATPPAAAFAPVGSGGYFVAGGAAAAAAVVAGWLAVLLAVRYRRRRSRGG